MHLALEAAQGAVQALVILYDDFQDDHFLCSKLTIELKKLRTERTEINLPENRVVVRYDYRKPGSWVGPTTRAGSWYGS